MEIIDLTSDDVCDIVSVDIGSKNFAYICFKNGKIKNWELLNLNLPKNYTPNVFFAKFAKVSTKLNSFIGEKTVLLVERQMNNSPRGMHKNVVVNLLVEAYLFSSFMPICKCLSISPEEVRKHFQLKRCENKKKSSIEKVIDYLESSKFASWLQFFNGNKKKDDLADSLLQAVYFQNNKNKFNK